MPRELALLWVLWLTHCCQMFCPSYLEMVNFVLSCWMKLHAKCWVSTVSREYRRGKAGVVFNKCKNQRPSRSWARHMRCPQRPPPLLLLQGLPARALGAPRSRLLRQACLWLPPHSSVHVSVCGAVPEVHVPASMSPAQPVHEVGMCCGLGGHEVTPCAAAAASVMCCSLPFILVLSLLCSPTSVRAPCPVVCSCGRQMDPSLLWEGMASLGLTAGRSLPTQTILCSVTRGLARFHRTGEPSLQVWGARPALAAPQSSDTSAHPSPLLPQRQGPKTLSQMLGVSAGSFHLCLLGAWLFPHGNQSSGLRALQGAEVLPPKEMVYTPELSARQPISVSVSLRDRECALAAAPPTHLGSTSSHGPFGFGLGFPRCEIHIWIFFF